MNLLLCGLCLLVSQLTFAGRQNPDTQIVRLSGNTFVTDDLGASINFYSTFLGMMVYRQFELPPASKTTYGSDGDEAVKYAVLIPTGWPIETPNLTSLNFAEIKNARNKRLTRRDRRNQGR